MNVEFQKMSFYTFSYFGSVKSSSTDYNESNKPNLKFLAHIGSKKSLVELCVSKNELSDFFHIFRFTEKLIFQPKPWFPKTHHILSYIDP